MSHGRLPFLPPPRPSSFILALFILMILVPCHALSFMVPLRSAAVSNQIENQAVPGPTATLDSGIIMGTTGSVPESTVTVNKFLGIPFAASPPVRFSPPEKPMPWDHVLKTTAKPKACIQQFSDPEDSRKLKQTVYNQPPPKESEDCLYVNVYAPATGEKNKTVMMWFYGGNLQLGSNAVDMYDGTSFAANQDVIIVSANYRTNVFGFPMAPQLPLTERNLGFLDQRLALKWVQNNIHAFGGDPAKVTIFGESAGSASVDILVTSMKENPPFRGAIMQSGQTSLYVNHNNSNYAPWTELVAELKCNKKIDLLECVREADCKLIKSIEESKMLRFVPVADNVTMLEYPEQDREVGKIATVPIMVGNNADEGRYFVYGLNDTLPWLRNLRPDLSELQLRAVMLLYPIDGLSITNPFQQAAKIWTDTVFQCPSAGVVSGSMHASIPTWRYFFNASFPNLQYYPDLGVYHSAEIPLMFSTYPSENTTCEQATLSEYMQTAWATFAKNPARGPGWTEGPVVGVLGAPGTNETDTLAFALDYRCSFWNPL